jgi:hypothetical protein
MTQQTDSRGDVRSRSVRGMWGLIRALAGECRGGGDVAEWKFHRGGIPLSMTMGPTAEDETRECYAACPACGSRLTHRRRGATRYGHGCDHQWRIGEQGNG